MRAPMVPAPHSICVSTSSGHGVSGKCPNVLSRSAATSALRRVTTSFWVLIRGAAATGTNVSSIVEVRSSGGIPFTQTLSVSSVSTGSAMSSTSSGATSLPIRCFMKNEKICVRDIR